MEVQHPKTDVKTYFNFTVHRPEPPDHQAQPALPKNLGTRAHRGPFFLWQSMQEQSLQHLSKSLREIPCSLWKVSVVFHDPRLLEGHLWRPHLAQQVRSFMKVGHKEHFLLACLVQTQCSCSRDGSQMCVSITNTSQIPAAKSSTPIPVHRLERWLTHPAIKLISSCSFHPSSLQVQVPTRCFLPLGLQNRCREKNYSSAII